MGFGGIHGHRERTGQAHGSCFAALSVGEGVLPRPWCSVGQRGTRMSPWAEGACIPHVFEALVRPLLLAGFSLPFCKGVRCARRLGTGRSAISPESCGTGLSCRAL